MGTITWKKFSLFFFFFVEVKMHVRQFSDKNIVTHKRFWSCEGKVYRKWCWFWRYVGYISHELLRDMLSNRKNLFKILMNFFFFDKPREKSLISVIYVAYHYCIEFPWVFVLLLVLNTSFLNFRQSWGLCREFSELRSTNFTILLWGHRP